MSENKDRAALLRADEARSADAASEPLPNSEICGNDLAIVMRAIRPLDCGALHCRYCPAGSNNQWQHEEHCIYEQSCRDAERAREIVAALRVQLIGSGNQGAIETADPTRRSARAEEGDH